MTVARFGFFQRFDSKSSRENISVILGWLVDEPQRIVIINLTERLRTLDDALTFSSAKAMCGRFTQAYTWQELVALYRLTVPAINLQPRYNIAPTTTIDVVIPRGGEQFELMRMRWGLIPSWWGKTAEETPSSFNARAETVATKPMFRAAFKRSRCVIPASGYYEWKPTPTGNQPYYISARDGSILSFAGLWDEWHDIEIGEVVKSCTIIVTAANALTRPIHDRMPAMLEQLEPWLAGTAGAEVLKPAPENMLQMWPVSRKVNRVGNDSDATLIEAIQ